ASVGRVFASVRASSTLHVPIVKSSMTGPDGVTAGQTGLAKLTVSNVGSAKATGLHFDTNVLPATPATVTGLPDALDAGASVIAGVPFAVPASAATPSADVVASGQWAADAVPPATYGTTFAGTVAPIRTADGTGPSLTIKVENGLPAPVGSMVVYDVIAT